MTKNRNRVIINDILPLQGVVPRDVILTRGVATGYDISGFQPENTRAITLKGLNLIAQGNALGN
jgi:hypothetical protein